MFITINNVPIPNLIGIKAERRARGTKIRYNANGGMLIDSVSRKYRLTVHFGKLSQYQLGSIFEETGGAFAEVSFESPFALGTVTRQFYIAEEPCETDFVRDGVTYYKAVKLVLEEK